MNTPGYGHGGGDTEKGRKTQTDGRLPVDPERLRKRFPDLGDDDLDAYVSVTRRVLADPAAKGRIMRGIMESARLAREKSASGAALDAEETLALRYLRAVEKMQAPVERRGTRGPS